MAGRFDSDGTPIVAINSWKATSFALYAIENWNGDLVATGTPRREGGMRSVHLDSLAAPLSAFPEVERPV